MLLCPYHKQFPSSSRATINYEVTEVGSLQLLCNCSQSRGLQQQECPHSGLCSVAVLVPGQDVQVAVGCRVVRGPALQHHHPEVEIQNATLSRDPSFKNSLGHHQMFFPRIHLTVVISLSLDAFSPEAPQNNANLRASSQSCPDKVSKDPPQLLCAPATVLNHPHNHVYAFYPTGNSLAPMYSCCLSSFLVRGSETCLSLSYWAWAFPGALQSKPIHQAPVLRVLPLPLATGMTNEQTWSFCEHFQLIPEPMEPNPHKLPPALRVPEPKICRQRESSR